MAAQLILLEDVEGLGQLGEAVTVADGYARNYLLPKKLAAPATAENLARMEARKLQLQKEYTERVSVAETLAEKIEKTSVTIPVEAGENDKLYGSVTAAHVVNALSEEKISIEQDAVQLEESIRELGIYTIVIKLHDEISASLKVWVVRK